MNLFGQIVAHEWLHKRFDCHNCWPTGKSQGSNIVQVVLKMCLITQSHSTDVFNKE